MLVGKKQAPSAERGSPCSEKLVLLAVQTQLQGFVGNLGLPHALRSVLVTVEAVVTVQQKKGQFSARGRLNILGAAQSLSYHK